MIGIGLTKKQHKEVGDTVRRVMANPGSFPSYRRKKHTLASSGGGGGSSVLYAKITSVTDSNNYKASIYTNSDFSDTPTTNADLYVMWLTDELAIGDPLPVKTTEIKDGSDVAEAESTVTVINATGHGFLVGEEVRMSSGATSGETAIIDSVATNSITLASALSAAPSAGDTFDVYKVTNAYESIQNFGVVG